MNDRLVNSSREAGVKLSRRQVLVTGVAAAFGIPASKSLALTSTEWNTYTSPESGASIQYPATWTIMSTMVPSLRYPYQSFGFTSGPAIAGVGDFPELESYPSDAVVAMLMHYDDLVLNDGAPPSSPTELVTVPAQFLDFQSFNAWFDGSVRSFMLRVWKGNKASDQTLEFLADALESLSVP